MMTDGVLLHHDEAVRTTIDLPEDLHRLTTAIARDAGTTLSETVTRLLRTALATPGPSRVTTSPVTGLPVISLGRGPVTSEDVRALDDEE
jgi:hypothetical protein